MHVRRVAAGLTAAGSFAGFLPAPAASVDDPDPVARNACAGSGILFSDGLLAGPFACLVFLVLRTLACQGDIAALRRNTRGTLNASVSP
jgi:hypothetical protein